MSTAAPKIAVITGRASGIGLGVAKVLAARGGWQVHILDVTEEEGNRVASSSYDLHFHKVDIADHSELAVAFKTAFVAGDERLDFVFANAGNIERSGIFDITSDSTDPPPEPNYLPLDLGYSAPCAQFAGRYKLLDGIRINALLPGAVRTSHFEEETWNQFSNGSLTPMDLITQVVLGFIEGNEIIDSKGFQVPATKTYGQAIVASAKQFFIIPDEYCDEFTALTMEHTRIENQVGLLKE